MKTKKNIYILVLILFGLGLWSCSRLPEGDKNIEEKLDGTWMATYYETEYEDGEQIKIRCMETVTYDAATHTFESTVDAKIVSPAIVNLFTLDSDGTWSADSKSLSKKYNVDNVDVTFHTGLLDAADRKEMEKELLSELEDEGGKEVCEILEITDFSFTVFDGESEIVYYMQ